MQDSTNVEFQIAARPVDVFRQNAVVVIDQNIATREVRTASGSDRVSPPAEPHTLVD